MAEITPRPIPIVNQIMAEPTVNEIVAGKALVIISVTHCPR